MLWELLSRNLPECMLAWEGCRLLSTPSLLHWQMPSRHTRCWPPWLNARSLESLRHLLVLSILSVSKRVFLSVQIPKGPLLERPPTRAAYEPTWPIPGQSMPRGMAGDKARHLISSSCSSLPNNPRWLSEFDHISFF